ncbi:MAG: hypothetical protein QOH57_5424 [Mycobacterium sp.]|nr:hypothetical protein [Mycobacterium sp.]
MAFTSLDPALPEPAGPVSEAVVELLTGTRRDATGLVSADADPWGLDLQLSLYACYELHYRGFAGVDPALEWDPELLRLRAGLERQFMAAVRDAVGEIGPDDTAEAEMDSLSIEPVEGEGPSYFLRDEGSWEQMREYFVHRSLYHLKEGDPHAWAIPRLAGQAKASFVAIEFDEYGGGHGERVHQQMFADLMAAAGLDHSYLGYLNNVPGVTLASVNLMSYFGLHRSMRGAAVGHFASTEITSSPGSRRLAEALERMGAADPCVAFYREHVVADAVHEQVVRTDVVGDLITREPQLESSVVFGIRARDVVEDALADHVMKSWAAQTTSLRVPLV